jgi:hypothetical protein
MSVFILNVTKFETGELQQKVVVVGVILVVVIILVNHGRYIITCGQFVVVPAPVRTTAFTHLKMPSIVNLPNKKEKHTSRTRKCTVRGAFCGRYHILILKEFAHRHNRKSDKNVVDL